MCIRDSNSVYRGCNTRHAQAVGLASRDEFAGKTDHDFISCLLYTSDAADERSSVDLGGRRIIKKKT